MAVPSASASRVAPRNILDLPYDILVNIFDFFRLEIVDDYGQPGRFWTFDEDNFPDLQNARLVCRVFHQLASLHLCPLFRLPLERSSLDKIDGMIKNPSILEGVRVVQIVLQYRPKEIAQSLLTFQQHRLMELGEIHEACLHHLDVWDFGAYDYDEDTICELPRRAYTDAINNYHEICSAWGLESDPSDGEVEGDKNDGYCSILRQGYNEYRRKHEEQYRLITDGSFVEAISNLASQAPRPCWLQFTDQRPYSIKQCDHDPIQTLNDREILSRYMSSPHKWRTIEALGKKPDLAPMQLLATLPIAIYRRGTMLQGVNTNCFPLVDGHYGVCGQSRHSLWDDLDASCKSLRTFSWGRGGALSAKDVRHDPPRGEDRATLDRYFGAMLSSTHLEDIYLNFHALGLNDGKEDHTLVGQNLEFDMNSVIGTTPYPLLKWVQIGSISLTQVNLERFIQGLGDELQWFHIFYVELAGSWAGIVDLLRKKYSLRCLEGRCTIRLGSLWGGEFGERKPKGEAADSFAMRWKRHWEITPVPVLITQSLQYACGDPQMTENPLRCRCHPAKLI